MGAHRRNFMPLKPGGAAPLTIQEQIIEDPITGLTFKFEVNPGATDAPYRMIVFGDFPYGNNREFLFDHEGRSGGRGTYCGCACPSPTWLKEVK